MRCCDEGMTDDVMVCLGEYLGSAQGMAGGMIAS